ncbi:hypothetical protein EWB00_005448 [Schistosoma japonicum]|uniref:Trematode PH-like domain-containing protein n=1 Tax=Schistosoma japonicum TaxID=6182 RepID=A0A4Z2DUC4_SCHJA|nr:hypothetical protein EWB00_005448 [Schistosoma japonicum]TNN20084.1 hypothetical protein EWB00_005448 [Schistosoma japonicum]TNN20085.1 hypothetical protein EWB00_005448 [Schistosoma japonicum]
MSIDHTRKRSNSLVPRIVENLPNDPVTGQSILFRTNFKGRDHSKIIDPAGFCDSKANQLLLKHLRKKRNHGYLYCLLDRIRFERRSRTKLFRDQIFYKDIKYVYFFSNLPNVFMLAMNDEKQRRIYETYSVNSMEDRNRIAELTQNKNSFEKLRTSICSQMINYENSIMDNGHISLEGEEEEEDDDDDNNEIEQNGFEEVDNLNSYRSNKRHSLQRTKLLPNYQSDFHDNFKPVSHIENQYSNGCLNASHIPTYYKPHSVARSINSPAHQSYPRQQTKSYIERTPSPTDYFVMQYQGRNSYNNQRISIHSPLKYNTEEYVVPVNSSEPLLTNGPIKEDGPLYLYVQRRPSKPEINVNETAKITKSPSAVTIYR